MAARQGFAKALRRLTVLGSVALLLTVAVSERATAELPRARHGADGVVASPSRQALDSRLQKILQRPDYRHALQAGGTDPRALIRWLWLQLRRVLARLGGLQETNYALFLVAVIAGLALLIPLLAHIIYTLVRFFGRHQPVEAALAAGDRLPRPLSPADLIREAERHAAEGQYREAVRSLYLALNRDLQLRGLLPRTSSQTNWECLINLSSMPQVLALMRPFTQTFDEKWYGGRAANADDVSRCRGWLEAVRQEVEAA